MKEPITSRFASHSAGGIGKLQQIGQHDLESPESVYKLSFREQRGNLTV